MKVFFLALSLFDRREENRVELCEIDRWKFRFRVDFKGSRSLDCISQRDFGFTYERNLSTIRIGETNALGEMGRRTVIKTYY